MDMSQMKNMIVLKNIPSNIIDEAIVVLKPNKKIIQTAYANKEIQNAKDDKKNMNKYIMKEAELVITDYISEIERKKNNDIKNLRYITIKYKRLKIISIILGIIIIISIII